MPSKSTSGHNANIPSTVWLPKQQQRSPQQGQGSKRSCQGGKQGYKRIIYSQGKMPERIQDSGWISEHSFGAGEMTQCPMRPPVPYKVLSPAPAQRWGLLLRYGDRDPSGQSFSEDTSWELLSARRMYFVIRCEVSNTSSR